MLARIRVLLVVTLFLFFAVPTSAATFSDNFDNPSFTNSNWSVLDLGQTPSPVWDFVTISGSNLGYHADTFSRSQEDSIVGTANLANSGQVYSTQNLSVQILLRLDNPGTYDGTAGGASILIASSPDESYNIGIQVDYELPAIEFDLGFTESISGTSQYLLRRDLTGQIDYNVFYSLAVEIDSQGYVDIYLDEVSTGTNLVSILNVDPTIRFSSGLVGLTSGSETTFDNFSLTGNPVPIPHEGDFDPWQRFFNKLSLMGKWFSNSKN